MGVGNGGVKAAATVGVPVLLALGFPLSQAVQRALGLSVTALARQEGWDRSLLSMVLNAHRHRVCPGIRDRLAEMLGATRGEVDAWIAAEAARRAEATPCSA